MNIAYTEGPVDNHRTGQVDWTDYTLSNRKCNNKAASGEPLHTEENIDDVGHVLVKQFRKE